MHNHTAALIAKNLPQFTARFGGAQIPEEQLAEFRRNCGVQARNTVLSMMQQNRMNLAQAQQQQAQAQAMQQAQAAQGGMMGQGI